MHPFHQTCLQHWNLHWLDSETFNSVSAEYLWQDIYTYIYIYIIYLYTYRLLHIHMYIYLHSFQDSRYINSNHIPSHFPQQKKEKTKERDNWLARVSAVAWSCCRRFWWKGVKTRSRTFFPWGFLSKQKTTAESRILIKKHLVLDVFMVYFPRLEKWKGEYCHSRIFGQSR